LRFLLDTHAWLWSVLDHPRLSRRARATLTTIPAHEHVGIAAISLKEASWHLARGRIVVGADVGPWPLWLRMAASAPHIEILPLTVDVAIEFIAATARVHDLTLITRDRPIRRSRTVRTLW
jgi:PIN domain nuclease of toxin-antitoxin system